MDSRCTLIHSGQDFVLASFYEKSTQGGQLISQVKCVWGVCVRACVCICVCFVYMCAGVCV